MNSFKANRFLWFVILFLLSVTVALALDDGLGRAANPPQRTSPLDSPLSTRSPLPTATATPTPTPTSPLPPTATPPSDLAGWPTPTPTPLPSPVRRALDFVAAQTDTAVDQLALFYQQPVIEPSDPTGTTVISVVRVQDEESGERYWVAVDEQNRAAFLPDFSADAIEQVAEDQSLNTDDLTVETSLYSTFLFSKQIVWVGIVVDTTSSESYRVTLDLTGAQVDLPEIEATETEALEATCGALDTELCRQLFLRPDDYERNVQIRLETELAIDEVTDILDTAEYDYQLDGRSIYAQLPKEMVLALGQQEGVSLIFPYFPDVVEPLDTNLILGLNETAGQITLALTSVKQFPALNYQIVVDLDRSAITDTRQITLAVSVEGILVPASGPAARGPATQEIELGELSGRYNLTIAYDAEDLLDEYTLIATNQRILLRPEQNSFTWPRYSTWLRLPEDALWFVVQSRELDAEGKPYETDREEFEQKSAQFYNELEALGADPIDPSEGIYTNHLFVPPWTSWQVPDRTFVQVPVAPTQAYLFKWPDIRYFVYQGDLGDVSDLIEAHCVQDVWITGYTWSGDVLDVCQQ